MDAAYPSTGLTGVCVQTMPGSKTESIGIQLAGLMTAEDVVNKINQYQARINRKIDKLVDMKQQAMDCIEQIKDSKYRTLLTLRYISNYKWVTVADLMGYTQDWVEMRLKREAIKAYEAVNKQVKTGIL